MMKDWSSAAFALAYNTILRAAREPKMDLIIARPTDLFPRYAFYAQMRGTTIGDMLFTQECDARYASDDEWRAHG